MASGGHTADLSVSTGIMLCYSGEMSLKTYNENKVWFSPKL